MPHFDGKDWLLLTLGVVAVAFIALWAMTLRAASPFPRPTLWDLAVGIVTDFFDTLGIGSFATTTALWRARRSVPDEHIPGTLNVGHTIPTFLQAWIYTQAVEVETKTLVALIASSVIGSWLGAGVVSRLPREKIRLGMAVCLLGAAGIMAYRLRQDGPSGNATELSGSLLLIGVAGNFVLGALMTLGIGLYAPCMLMVGMLGMNQTAAFPIMMGSCAFLMPVASAKFVRTGAYSARAALGLTLGGLPAVWVAAKLVKSLPLDYVKWLVVVVVIYTAVTMLLAARGSHASKGSTHG